MDIFLTQRRKVAKIFFSTNNFALLHGYFSHAKTQSSKDFLNIDNFAPLRLCVDSF